MIYASNILHRKINNALRTNILVDGREVPVYETLPKKVSYPYVLIEKAGFTEQGTKDARGGVYDFNIRAAYDGQNGQSDWLAAEAISKASVALKPKFNLQPYYRLLYQIIQSTNFIEELTDQGLHTEIVAELSILVYELPQLEQDIEEKGLDYVLDVLIN